MQDADGQRVGIPPASGSIRRRVSTTGAQAEFTDAVMLDAGVVEPNDVVKTGWDAVIEANRKTQIKAMAGNEGGSGKSLR